MTENDFEALADLIQAAMKAEREECCAMWIDEETRRRLKLADWDQYAQVTRDRVRAMWDKLYDMKLSLRG